MYCKAGLSAKLLIVCSVLITEVCSKRFTSPQYLFSDEPNILDGTFHTSQTEPEHERFDRSTDEKPAHRRFRRQSPPRNDPKITKSKPLCDHNSLFIRWTDTNLVSQNGSIIALCREFGRSTTQNSALVFVSYDYGLSWKNLTEKFESLLGGKKPAIDMYYTVPEKPDFILFTDKVNQQIFYTTNAGRNISAASVSFAPTDVSINPRNSRMVVVSQDFTENGKTRTLLHISKNGGQSYNRMRSYTDVKAFYWGDTGHEDKSTDLFVEAKKSGGKAVQGYKLDCSSTGAKSTCATAEVLTEKAPLNGDITDFLVKGPYMFATQQNQDKSGVNLFVKYKRSGTFKKANIITTSPLKELFVYDISGGLVMLVVNHRKNETNLYNSLDVTGLNYSMSLPRVLYHNPNTEVSSHWLRNAVKFRFVDIWRVNGLPSVYFATQLTVGPVGGRYLISKMTFDKGGVWQKVKGPGKDKYGRSCYYPSCSLHVNLLYGSIYRYSKTTPLMSRASAPGLLMATGVLGTNLKITPDTYLSRDGGNTFKLVLRGKRRFSFGDHGGFVLASDFQSSRYLQYSFDFQTFNHILLPDTPRSVDIKKILTEPGEKGVIFLVIGVTNGFYHVYQVNATRTLGVPCTDKDFYTVNVTDVGIGGCAIHQVQLRNSSTQCLTGKDYKKVVSIKYNNCLCRRRHYQCDVRFAPDERGSCVQLPDTNLIPTNCPEGSFYQKTRGYVKMSEYDSCKEDNVTANTLSDVKTPCPVEKLQLHEVKTIPAMEARAVRIGLGEELHTKVVLKKAHLPHVTFTYVLGDFNVGGEGESYSSFKIRINKTGSFVLHITISNLKSNLYYSINVNVIRKLNASLMNIVSYPFEPSIKEKVILRFESSSAVNPREYGFPLEYYDWSIDKFNPSQTTTILQKRTLLPTLSTTFNVSGFKRIYLTISNNVSAIKLQQDLRVTADYKPKNVKVSFNDPILTVTWDKVEEPGVIRYRVFYKEERALVFSEASCKPTTEPKCEIRDLSYYTKIYVEIDTALTDGYGPRSDTVSFLIPSGKPTVPENVKLANAGEIKLEASWMAPKSANGKLTGYKFKFFKSSDKSPKDGTLINDPNVFKKVFSNLDSDVDYIFEVAAVNEKYTGAYSERMTARTGVDKPTLPPTGIVVTELTPSSAMLTWTAPLLKKGSEIYFSPKSYVIYMNKGGARGMTNITSTPVNSYNFTGLKAETKYEVGIAAMANKEGPMAKFTFTTTLGPPPAPTDLTTTSVGAHKVSFKWSSVVSDDKITYFTLYQLSPLTSREPWRFKTTKGDVTDLMPYTKYTFAVSASNTHSESSKSKNLTFTTGEDKPQKPFEVRIKDLSPASSSVNVSWDPPRYPNGKIISYTVTWFKQSREDIQEKESTVVDDKRWVRIDHLKGEAYYIFQVQAKTKIGLGDPHVELFKTHYYPYGSQEITIVFEKDGIVKKLGAKKEFKKSFIEVVASVAGIKGVRIADVNLNEDENSVKFELISKDELHRETSNEILDEMDVVKNKLKPSFMVLDARTKANSLKSGLPRSGKSQASTGSGGSSSMALVVGLVCAAVILILIVVIVMLFMRYRRKSVYDKFDNNQFQYNHEDDTVRYQGSPDVDIAPSSQKRRHKDIETVPLADADELT